jgi:hypothetical protein
MAGAVMPTICARQTDVGIPGEAGELYMAIAGSKATNAGDEESVLDGGEVRRARRVVECLVKHTNYK